MTLFFKDIVSQFLVPMLQHGNALATLQRCVQLAIVSLLLLLSACDHKTEQVQDEAVTVSDLLGNNEVDGYERAIKPRDFTFPADHASHPTFRNEWWYITGNVSSEKGHEFGYQVTLFRNALDPAKTMKADSRWATKHIWMAHLALTDITAQQYYHGERFARDALGLAGFQQQPFKVWLEDWQIVAAEQGEFPWQLIFQHENIKLDLQLSPVKQPILQGEKGLSQKSAQVGNASYYYSMTHLKTTGQIRVNQQSYQVTGKSWLDREWSTSALGANQVGWDWFSLQFDNNTELMYYQMRTKSGKADPYSSGKYIDANNATQTIASQQIQLTPLKTWTSPEGRQYPVQWRMHIPTWQKTWRIEARLDQQEIVGVVHYWEGAVRIFDEKTKQQVGKGYLEMTGY